jgi:hypothetical protein
MGHVQHLSLESLVKMDHFQKEPPLNLRRNTGAPEWSMSAFGPKRTSLVAPHMSAFGGKADIAIALQNVG